MTTSTTTPSMSDLIAQENAFVARAVAAGVTGEAWEAMYALRHVADFLDHAANLVAGGRDVRDPEVANRVRWAGWKLDAVLAEFEVLVE